MRGQFASIYGLLIVIDPGARNHFSPRFPAPLGYPLQLQEYFLELLQEYFLELLQDAGVRGNTLVNHHFLDLRITFEYMGIKWEATGPWQRFLG